MRASAVQDARRHRKEEYWHDLEHVPAAPGAHIRVRARNSMGASSWSPPLHVLPPASRLPAAEAPAVVATTATSFSLSWPSVPGATSYEVHHRALLDKEASQPSTPTCTAVQRLTLCMAELHVASEATSASEPGCAAVSVASSGPTSSVASFCSSTGDGCSAHGVPFTC